VIEKQRKRKGFYWSSSNFKREYVLKKNLEKVYKRQKELKGVIL